MTDRAIRTPWQVTWSVWKALFLREFMTRITQDRLAWFWMLFEPIAFILIFVAIRTVVMGSSRLIAGAEFVPWLLTGLLGFFLFRENMIRSIKAVEQTRNLFSYRQVKPVDPILVRCFLEGWIKTFILAGFIAVGVLLGLGMFPDRFLLALFGWISLWLLGISAALLVSVLSALVNEIGKIIQILSFPLLLISGVMFPLNLVPHDLAALLLMNPILHGIELLRAGFFEAYDPVRGVSTIYLWLWILGMLMLGLTLHMRFELRLKAL
jgi:capsular polysaccharide transport system permease protein